MGSPRNYSRNRRGASPEWDRGIKSGRNVKRAPPARREIQKEKTLDHRNSNRHRVEAQRSNGRLPEKHHYEGPRHPSRSNNEEPRGTERWGHSGYKELYENGSSSLRSRRSRSRSRSPVRRSRSRSRGRRSLNKQAEQPVNSRSTLGLGKSRSHREERSQSPSPRQSQRETRLKRIPSPEQTSRVVHKSPNKSAKMSLSPLPQRSLGNASSRSNKSHSSSHSPSTSSGSRSSSSSSDYSSSSSYRETSRRLSSGSSVSESEGENEESRKVHVEEEEEGEMKDEPPKASSSGVRMSLSERFGKLAQFSSQRRNFEMVQLRIVASAGNESKNVSIDEHGPAPLIAKKPELPKPEPPPPEMGRWKDFRVDAWQEFHDYHHRDLPNDWEDIRVRHKYYTERGHFARDMSLEELARWEDWWRRYQQWRKGYERAWQSLHGRGVPVEYPDWNSYRNTAQKEPQLGSVRSRLGWRNCDNSVGPRRKKF